MMEIRGSFVKFRNFYKFVSQDVWQIITRNFEGLSQLVITRLNVVHFTSSYISGS